MQSSRGPIAARLAWCLIFDETVMFIGTCTNEVAILLVHLGNVIMVLDFFSNPEHGEEAGDLEVEGPGKLSQSMKE